MSKPDDHLSDLPPMREGVLSDETLAEYVRDLDACAGRVEVRAKSAGCAMSSQNPLTLAGAISALKSGDVRGVQLRYRFDGVAWCDTLTRGSAGIRLVRVEMPVV